MAAKEKEIATNTKSIEVKTERLGQLSVDIVELKEDLDDTAKSLKEDKAFLKNLGSQCETKKAEWEERSKMRQQELLALADTIKMLNDDDALELFKKTLPAPSLLQIQFSSKAVKQQALRMLKAGGSRKDPRFQLVMLALTGKSNGTFDKVLKMIDDMVALLGKEQEDDDSKKGYCEENLDKNEDEKKALERIIAGEESAIATAKETI